MRFPPIAPKNFFDPEPSAATPEELEKRRELVARINDIEAAFEKEMASSGTVASETPSEIQDNKEESLPA